MNVYSRIEIRFIYMSVEDTDKEWDMYNRKIVPVL